MRKNRSALLAVLGLALAFGPALPANAAPAENFCVATVGKPGSRSVEKTCDSKPDTAKLRAAKTAASASAATMLMSWYDNANWDASDGIITWYGYAGNCDKSGYQINMDANNFPSWRNRISSWTVHGTCWKTLSYDVAYWPSGPSKRLDGDVAWVGADWNDMIEAFSTTSS
ncbi:hypothetical protein SK803_06235 [Lentzea sp. BCCO 10_0856]|uniref:Peptidase inhibitor family I36 n=1 Tax=Lentzea miocenica TaxID=3095431 RepID=A0ABU4SV68_9PSEU|nr:hypothetical protein [Lentzea sp. BCCO 10_0856]MDX8029801.1 hypothetical protein [Lentzea sp. BCCO 10_0856]